VTLGMSDCTSLSEMRPSNSARQFAAPQAVANLRASPPLNPRSAAYAKPASVVSPHPTVEIAFNLGGCAYQAGPLLLSSHSTPSAPSVIATLPAPREIISRAAVTTAGKSGKLRPSRTSTSLRFGFMKFGSLPIPAFSASPLVSRNTLEPALFAMSINAPQKLGGRPGGKLPEIATSAPFQPPLKFCVNSRRNSACSSPVICPPGSNTSVILPESSITSRFTRVADAVRIELTAIASLRNSDSTCSPIAPPRNPIQFA
jgi:hypothetical protein